MTVRRKTIARPTRAEFEALQARIEDLEDVLLLRMAEARGPTKDGLDAQKMRRLIAGESPLRIWREKRRLSVRGLARKAAVDPAYLSQIENGRKPGSVRALDALARALDVDLEDIVQLR